jgi:hypothetical protein
LLLLYVGAIGYVTYLLWYIVGKREALTGNDGGFPSLTSVTEEADALR